MPQTLEVRAHPVPESDTLDHELIAPTDPRAGLISINPDRVSGAPCFAGTRVPVKHLWDYLEAGESLEEFLEGFQGVTREQAVGVMEIAFQRLIEGVPNL